MVLKSGSYDVNAVNKLHQSRSRMLRVLVAATLLALVFAGGTAVAAHKTVTLSVDGASMTVPTMKSRVIDVVKENGFDVGERDDLYPAADSPVHQSDTIVLRRSRPLEISTDGGGTEQVWTTAATVDEALAQLRMTDKAPLAASRGSRVPLGGMALPVVSPKTVRLDDDCRRTIFSFLETGTVLEMFKDFMHYIRLDGGEQNTSTWEARLGDRRVLLENSRMWYGRQNTPASRQRFIKVMILKASDSVEKTHFYGSGWGDIESIWTFSLFTAPEFADIHAMVPSSYDRRVHNIVTNKWLWSAVHRRPALRRRNRLRAVMEADINIKIYY